MFLDHPESLWFAVQVKHSHEKMVAFLLRQKGYESFLPTYRVKRRWSDRVKELEVPLFPCYLFCLFNATVGSPIITTPGVVRIVGSGNNPTAVSVEEIEAIRRLVDSGLAAEPCPFIQEGQIVRIEIGPLQGLQGRVLTVKNRQRLVLSVSLLQRAVSVEIERDWISPVPSISRATASRS